jgi:hypothetical protein
LAWRPITSSNRLEIRYGAGTRRALVCRASCSRSFQLLEEALTALGVVVWPMVEVEADDALASAAWLAAKDPRVERVVICTPDKDLAQSVVGTRVVQLNRRTKEVFDEAGVMKKFGVRPRRFLTTWRSWATPRTDIRDWPAGVRNRPSAVLRRFGHIENIPGGLARLACERDECRATGEDAGRSARLALLFRTLATLRSDVPLFKNVDELKWTGPTPAFAAMAARLEGTTTRRSEAQEGEHLFRRLVLDDAFELLCRWHRRSASSDSR